MKHGIFPVSVSSLALLCLLGATSSAQTEAGRVSTPVEHPPLNPATDSQAKPEMGPKVVLTILVPMECIHLSLTVALRGSTSRGQASVSPIGIGDADWCGIADRPGESKKLHMIVTE